MPPANGLSSSSEDRLYTISVVAEWIAEVRPISCRGANSWNTNCLQFVLPVLSLLTCLMAEGSEAKLRGGPGVSFLKVAAPRGGAPR